MGSSSDSMAPLLLLTSLRASYPQFAERDQSGQYAQQDADEALMSLIAAMQMSSEDMRDTVDRLMSIEMLKEQRCIEDPGSPSTSQTERFMQLECNISVDTNFLVAGLKKSLDEQIEKNSPTLGRPAVYEQSSRMSKLPKYLFVHMVRFYWRRDVQKKAKIMRKVAFPLRLDAIDLVTDDLRERIRPVNNSARAICQTRDDRARVAMRSHDSTFAGQELEKRVAEDRSLSELVASSNVSDAGANPTGVYELCGLVTHKGPSADSGHYIGWTRQENGFEPLDEQKWHKFDDDKVTSVTGQKILSMDGGGEDSVAYILLYKSVL